MKITSSFPETLSIGFRLLLFVLTFWVNGQTMSIQGCLEYAEKNNWQLQKSRNAVEMADLTLDQSRAAQLPTLNGSASHNYNFGRNIDPFTNQYTTSRVRSNNIAVNSSLNLFSGLQLQYSIKQSQADKAASMQDAEEVKRQLFLDVAASYLDVRLQQELVRQAQKRVLISENSYKQAEQLVKGGILPESNLTELYAQWKSDELTIVTAQAQQENALLILKSVMNYPLEQALLVDTTDVTWVASEYSLDSSLATAVESHPGMKSNEWRFKSSQWSYKVAYARYFPRLTFNASVSTLYSSSSREITGYSLAGYQFVGIVQNTVDTVVAPNVSPEYETKSFNNQLKDNFNRFVGLTLTVPILNGLQVRKSVQRARIVIRNAELDRAIKENSIHQEVVRNYTQYLTSSAQYKSAGVAKEASRQALNQAEKRFGAGIGTAFDVTQALQRLAVAEAEETRARYNLVYRAKILEFYRSGSF